MQYKWQPVGYPIQLEVEVGWSDNQLALRLDQLIICDSSCQVCHSNGFRIENKIDREKEKETRKNNKEFFLLINRKVFIIL